jgi:hypothetical protein
VPFLAVYGTIDRNISLEQFPCCRIAPISTELVPMRSVSVVLVLDGILVTADRKSFPIHLNAHFAQGRHTGGVFVIAPEKAWRLIYDDIVFVAHCSSAEEWIDQIIFLPCFSE